MPLRTVAPPLDDRNFEALKREALLRIPRYNPEWTDFNESDPGVTLVELFAWFTEMMLFRMNQVPERNFLAFVRNLGLELRSAEAARAYLTFTPQTAALLPAGQESFSVPKGTQVSATGPEGMPPLVFETAEGLDLIRLKLHRVQVFDGLDFSDQTEANKAVDVSFQPFGSTPQIGNALYLGFKSDGPVPTGRLFPQRMNFRVSLPLAKIAGQPISAREFSGTPKASVDLIWEYRPLGLEGRWRRLSIFKDESLAFTREGMVQVQGPSDIRPSKEGKVTNEELFWLRVRMASGSYPAAREPIVDLIRPNVVPADNLSTAFDEFLGDSQGIPNQTFQLGRRPVQIDSLELSVQDPGGTPEVWLRQPDLRASGPDDPHYQLDPASGEVHFGDGRNGRIPAAGAELLAVKYRYGGGEAGNVAASQIKTLLSTPTGVESVTNERPAAGGRSEQGLDEFVRQAPAQLRHRDRAISATDFRTLATEVGGIARATAIPLFHPNHPGVEVPGVTTVVVIPDSEDVPPKPSPAQLEAVIRYLEPRRLLSSELYVMGPVYRAIRVEAKLAVDPSAAFDVVRREAITALQTFLGPLARPTVGHKERSGWPFGQDLYRTSLFAELQRVTDVRAVLVLEIRVDGQLLPPETPFLRLANHEMVYAEREHDIVLTPYQDR
jgi:predicted phage baseplate assembly protein